MSRKLNLKRTINSKKKETSRSKLASLSSSISSTNEEDVIRPNRQGPRQLNRSKFQAYVLKKNAAKKDKVAGAVHLFFRTLLLIRDNWEVFLGIGIVYMILDLILVRGLSTINLVPFKNASDLKFHGFFGGIGTGISLFSTLLSSSGSSSSSTSETGLYQGILVIVVSLAIVWCLRQSYNKIRVTVSDGFYKGMYPIIVVLLVGIVVGIEIGPLIISGLLFSNLISGKIIFSLFQKLIVGGLCLILAFPTFYMLCSSLFALYIATLPNMSPMVALRSARELVKHRRLVIVRKLLFIPISMFIVGLVLMLPVLILLTPIAPWVYFVLTTAGLIFIHGYMYSLYRELI
jgi:hypothetical protein